MIGSKGWDRDFQHADSIREKAKVILYVAKDSDYCVACAIDYIEQPPEYPDKTKGCLKCRLAEVHRLCSASGSTFRTVFLELKRTAGFPEDE